MSHIDHVDIQFFNLMQEMRSYTKNSLNKSKVEPFVPSTPELQAYSNMLRKEYNSMNLAQQKAANDVIAELKDIAEPGTNSVAEISETEVTNNTIKYQNDIKSDPNHADENWISDMNKSRQKVKDGTNKVIDESFDEAIRLGLQHPAARSAINNFMDQASNFIINLCDKISKFILNAVNQFIEWLTKAWEAIKSFFEVAYSSISSFFKVIHNPQN
ncbi:hypothetical protein [Photorhabdus australis]|uniref:hypothetical protein n=1 Tax=Photorhabdus australis TaxID=286156 RepID=UPI00055FF64B|nr:hypothetical protein [Photorhabdus australis]